MKKHARKAFTGAIKYLSLSPHGDPEGVVLENGTFIKTPPHSLFDKKLFKIGALVSGEGELITEEPNAVFHHAVLQSGAGILANDATSKEKREECKEKHKAEMKDRKHAKDEKLTLQGRLLAVARKPKGELDRLILEPSVSVHVPKDVDDLPEDLEIGSMIEVRGEARRYGDSIFLKAERIQSI